MTLTARERPDPYAIHPRSKLKSRARVHSERLPAPEELVLKAGLRAMTHEQLEEARGHLESLATPESLAAREPWALDALAYLSSVRWGLGHAEDAIDDAARALELAPERFAANQKAGEMALRLGNLDIAEARFLAALRASEPGTPNAKAAESCLRESRRRSRGGIRHEVRTPRLGGLMARLSPARWRSSQTGRAAGPEMTALK
jgi:tetratricopeptide (TPR) repeat protein